MEIKMIRRQTGVCLAGCLAGMLAALFACFVLAGLIPDFRVALGAGVGLQIFTVLPYAVMKKPRQRRMVCLVGTVLANFGTGMIISAHMIFAGFCLSVADLFRQLAIPAAVFAVLYLLILVFPKIRIAGKIAAALLCAAQIVLFAVLWSKNGAAAYSFSLYMAVFVLFYVLVFPSDAAGRKSAGDFLFLASLGALAVILVIVAAVISEGDCCDGADCCDLCDCASGKRKNR